MVLFLSHLFVTICYRRVEPVTAINKRAFYQLKTYIHMITLSTWVLLQDCRIHWSLLALTRRSKLQLQVPLLLLQRRMQWSMVSSDLVLPILLKMETKGEKNCVNIVWNRHLYITVKAVLLMTFILNIFLFSCTKNVFYVFLTFSPLVTSYNIL